MTAQQKAERFVREQLNTDWYESLEYNLSMNDWLFVLMEDGKEWPTRTVWGRETLCLQYTNDVEIGFNLLTGQPATEADYTAFCNIVGI